MLQIQIDHFDVDVDVDVVVDVVDHVDGVNWTLAPYLRPLSELRPGFLAVLWEIYFLSIKIFSSWPLPTVSVWLPNLYLFCIHCLV